MWDVAKAGFPLHKGLPPADELPWTISYVVRKRMQIDSYSELPEEKRPPDNMIWYGTGKELKRWFDKVLKGKQDQDTFILEIDDSELEG